MSSKFRIYSSNALNKDVSWDVDGAFALPTDLTIRKYNGSNSSPQLGDNYITPIKRPQELNKPKRKYKLEEDIKEDYILLVFSKKYPINIEKRTDNSLLQDFDLNIPNLQFLEDILIKGSRFKKMEKKELRIDNDESKLNDFESSFWDFLQNKTYKSFRDFILNSKTFKVPASKAAITKEVYIENNINGLNFLNLIFSQNNFLTLTNKYKFEVLAGAIKSEDTSIDIFDYNTDEDLKDPKYSKHFQKYWTPIQLDDQNLLCLYNNLYINNTFLLTNHPNWKGQWDPLIEKYNLDEVINYQGNYYQCITTHDNTQFFNYNYWNELLYLNTKWNDTQIRKFNYIYHNKELYLALTNEAYTTEPPNTTNWLPLIFTGTPLNEDDEYPISYTEQFSFLFLNNLFPEITNYNDPLLIKLKDGYDTEDYTADLLYTFEYDIDKPNRDGEKSVKVDNPHICFKDLKGILRYSRPQNKLFFYPTIRNFEIKVTDYDEETLVSTIEITNHGSVERIIPKLNKDSVDKSGTMYISNNFTIYITLEEDP